MIFIPQAAYHGVPVLAIPIAADQLDNAGKAFHRRALDEWGLHRQMSKNSDCTGHSTLINKLFIFTDS